MKSRWWERPMFLTMAGERRSASILCVRCAVARKVRHPDGWNRGRAAFTRSRSNRSRVTGPATPRWETWMATGSMRLFCTRCREAATIPTPGSRERRSWMATSWTGRTCGASTWGGTSARASTTPSSWSMTWTATDARRWCAKRRMARRTGPGRSLATRKRTGANWMRIPGHLGEFCVVPSS